MIRIAAAAGLLIVLLAACQSPQQSMDDAEYTCEASGLRPGTRAFERCANVNYSYNRQRSQDTANAVAIGAAAGAIGGAVVGAASTPRYYYHRPYYYRHCNAWRCW